mmetsp:Transcript_24678/g.70431  ORF Transcript_24678/g.70431 Transcript_24678/m.70431 type:complete len:341 (+) Transcript_24678:1-1023(+)
MDPVPLPRSCAGYASPRFGRPGCHGSDDISMEGRLRNGSNVRLNWAFDDVVVRDAEVDQLDQRPVSPSCAAQCVTATAMFSHRGNATATGRRRPHFGSETDGCSLRGKRGRRRAQEVDDWGFRRIAIPEGALRPLCHIRFCVGALLVLTVLRRCAASVCISPVGLSWTAHMLSSVSDIIAGVAATPVLIPNLVGACVHHRCLGSLLTLLLTAALCNFGASIVFLSSAGGIFSFMGPVATDEGAPKSIAVVGVWECILLSSVSLEFALCISTWQFYGAFREAGIYPPNGGYALVRREVSPLEFLCEAEDVALLSEQCVECAKMELADNAQETFDLGPSDLV